MNKKLRNVSAIMLSVCTAATLFTSCADKTESVPTETSSVAAENTKAETVINNEGEVLEIATQNGDYTIYKPQKATKAPDVQYTYNITPANPENIDTPNKAEGKPENSQNTKPVSNEKIEEKSNGLSIITKSSTVYIGNSATIMIQGNPGKKYTIDFYKNSSDKASYDGLNEMTADENGFVSWTFDIDSSCETGNRKIYIKEKNSSNYIQTSIYVQ